MTNQTSIQGDMLKHLQGEVLRLNKSLEDINKLWGDHQSLVLEAKRISREALEISYPEREGEYRHD